jgi:hypothetical protein
VQRTQVVQRRRVELDGERLVEDREKVRVFVGQVVEGAARVELLYEACPDVGLSVVAIARIVR